MRLWRISNHADLSGLGGLRTEGRWHTRGRPVVYLAESPASALLEVLVHLEIRDTARLPRRFQLLEIEADDDLLIQELPPMRDDWRGDPGRTRALGDVWLAQGETPMLRVLSAIVPFVWNVLLNPLHPDAGRLSIVAGHHVPFDERLFRRPGH